MMDKIAFGGGCHWCTEAIFLSLRGVAQAEQGWIASTTGNDNFSEAVIVHYNPAIIDLASLIAVHLHTHSSTSTHALRNKYRSAVYIFNEEQRRQSKQAIVDLQPGFSQPIITQVLPFCSFRPSMESEQNYYYNNPAKPFCETHIHPKLKIIIQRFSRFANLEKMEM